MPPTLKRLALLGALAIPFTPDRVDAQAPSAVIDSASMFSDGAIREAKAELVRIDRAYGLTLTIETIDSLKGQEIDLVAVREAEKIAHKGIFILIARRDHKVEVLASPRALREELGTTRLNAIRDAFLDPFRKDQIDAGLAKGTQAAGTALAAIRPGRRAEPSTAGGSSNGPSPLILRDQIRLTLAGARRTTAGAESRALEKGYKMTIAAVDDGGHLLAFSRMDGARPASATTAIARAEAAATHRLATGSGVSSTINAQFRLPEGIPIVVDGQVIGAIGVGGGSDEQDAEVARAGVEAFLAGLQEKAKEPEEKAKPAEGETTPK